MCGSSSDIDIHIRKRTRAMSRAWAFDETRNNPTAPHILGRISTEIRVKYLSHTHIYIQLFPAPICLFCSSAPAANQWLKVSWTMLGLKNVGSPRFLVKLVPTLAPARINISATAMLPAPAASWRGVNPSPAVKFVLAPDSSRASVAEAFWTPHRQKRK